ncbi:MAG TPA: CsbD family protein [Verrucomicrobiae bacterium]|nr:CsbD family protein [Verrucomicrobiae bacterium]
MNKLEIKGDWNIAKGKIKQKRAKLTDDDLKYSAGQEHELVGRIQKATGEARLLRFLKFQSVAAVATIARDCLLPGDVLCCLKSAL